MNLVNIFIELFYNEFSLMLTIFCTNVRIALKKLTIFLFFLCLSLILIFYIFISSISKLFINIFILQSINLFLSREYDSRSNFILKFINFYV